MAEKTTNLDLAKPELDDSIKLSVLNENFGIIDAAVAEKVDKEEGKGLSANDFTDALKARFEGYESQIAVNRTTLGYQAKNLLNNKETTRTISGVTFTVNADKTVTVNGTAAANITTFALDDKFPVGDDPMILSGCPDGGSIATNSSYRLSIVNGASNGGEVVTDIGNGAIFNNSQVTTGIGYVRIRIGNGAVLDNITFRPMIRCAEITDDTYEPYKPSVEERLAALEAAVMGGGVT